jgi:hypothetical protein
MPALVRVVTRSMSFSDSRANQMIRLNIIRLRDIERYLKIDTVRFFVRWGGEVYHPIVSANICPIMPASKRHI